MYGAVQEVPVVIWLAKLEHSNFEFHILDFSLSLAQTVFAL